MTAAAVLAEARRDLGMTGRPNPITREYAARHGQEFLNAPWCQMSITHWARQSRSADAVLPAGDRAFTVWHAQDGQRAGRWHPGTTANIRAHARPGAVVFFDWGGSDQIGAIDHVGIVERVLPDGRVQTIEGNTADACKRRVRAANVIAGFWNPDYQEDDMPSAKEIADAVYERMTGTVTDDVWAAREGILEPGQKIDPKTAFRQIWAYGKDGHAQLRVILAKLGAQDIALRALADALAAQNDSVDADALVARIEAAIENVRVRLDVTDDDPAPAPAATN
ncbi:CHAP domain-containing protein [Sphaerisporangium sp. TRM90804]|uniref:CHAP domain-containing protein n=1 Tax=Sphaerisporangium sp. TRM90804 TaxID=3031113 RepID=UPI0024496DA8|nr:CHAP domain-containing protein [Sphaerisporangium sp. TRM90804]MDH2429304.1 CHAP domain-containing protein [Sphaerisporangium sp. TRM90804]